LTPGKNQLKKCINKKSPAYVPVIYLDAYGIGYHPPIDEAPLSF